MSARNAALLDDVRRVLWCDWDPIGVNAGMAYDPTDLDAGTNEYDHYAGRILKLMKSGAEATEVARRLGQLSVDAMGIAPDIERDKRIAETLVALLTKEG